MAITLSIVKWDILTPYYPRISSEEVGCFQGASGNRSEREEKKKKKDGWGVHRGDSSMAASDTGGDIIAD